MSDDSNFPQYVSLSLFDAATMLCQRNPQSYTPSKIRAMLELAKSNPDPKDPSRVIIALERYSCRPCRPDEDTSSYRTLVLKRYRNGVWERIEQKSRRIVKHGPNGFETIYEGEGTGDAAKSDTDEQR